MSQIDDLKLKSHPNHPVPVVLLPVGEQESGHQEVKGPNSHEGRWKSACISLLGLL